MIASLQLHDELVAIDAEFRKDLGFTRARTSSKKTSAAADRVRYRKVCHV